MKVFGAVGGLVIHIALTLASRTYGSLLLEAGRSISHANDISDIPRLTLIGFALVAFPVMAAGVTVGMWLERA
jgi:hypothetical protein